MHHLTNKLAAAVLAATLTASAVETKTWVQSEASEFEKGTLRHLALSSKGRLTLAPTFQEIYDAATPQLWAVIADAKGKIYTGGADGKVFVAGTGEKPRLLATLQGGSVHALALNKKNELFAAVMPEGKIYRIGADGKATLFCETKTRYVWGMVFDASGTLYAATGDPGQILKIGSDGKPSVFYDAGETHVRSLALDAKGNLIAGTEPGGWVVRINPAGKAFILYQTARREVTAVTEKDGVIYAAATGAKPTRAVPLTPAQRLQARPPVVPTPVVEATQPGSGGDGSIRVQTVPVPPSLNPSVTAPANGSDIYRIDADGEPRKLWSSPTAIVYSLAFDANGKLLAATGNEGRLYRIESEQESTLLVNADPPQITALAQGPGGAVYAATANSGRLFQLGPKTETEGSIESDSLDATEFTYWGRLRWEGETRGGSIAVETHSGNVDRTDVGWSDWTPVQTGEQARVPSPAARFLAWRATLKPASNGTSPELRLVEVAYQQKNVAPELDAIELMPPNYKVPAPSSVSLSGGGSLSLGPIGQVRRDSPSTPNNEPAGAMTVSYDKGSQGVRWKASDLNGDTLLFKIEMKGVGESNWMKLKDEVRENRFSFDTSAFADGQYQLRVTANDQTDNYPGQGLTTQIETDPFTIDNTAPQVSGLSAAVRGGKLEIKFRAADSGSALQSAEYSLNGGDWTSVMPSTRMTDSHEHDYTATVEKLPAGALVVAVRVYDAFDNSVVVKTSVTR